MSIENIIRDIVRSELESALKSFKKTSEVSIAVGHPNPVKEAKKIESDVNLLEDVAENAGQFVVPPEEWGVQKYTDTDGLPLEEHKSLAKLIAGNKWRSKDENLLFETIDAFIAPPKRGQKMGLQWVKPNMLPALEKRLCEVFDN